MRRLLVAGTLLTAVLSGCGDDGGDGGAALPAIVVSTNVLGDVVEHLVGGAAEVEVLLPPNADPHDFQPSARQAAALREAELVVVNGAGFEEGLADAIEGAEDDGVRVVEAIAAVETLSEGDRTDPHFFNDPARMADAAEALLTDLTEAVPDIDRGEAERYVDSLRALDADVEATLATVPEPRRTLVTNHEALAYLADRYGFEILGVVIPGGSTQAEPSAEDLAVLAQAIEDAGVTAIFAETSAPAELAQALAEEVGDVEVVELFTESLGEQGSPADSYVGMQETNADRIAEALA
jgi:zinc/manganese transport system substrate-binding protein